MKIIEVFYANIKIVDIIDLIIVAFIFYRLFVLLQGTRVVQLLKGVGVLIILTQLTRHFELRIFNWLLTNAMTFGAMALLIVFQPELRKGLEYIGRSKLLSRSIVEVKKEYDLKILEDISYTVDKLSKEKIGALIVIERQTGLNEIADTGIIVGGKISREILLNIFVPNTPLHDGAVIIKNDKIKAASCILPLSENFQMDKGFGTRHRAAVGISEVSDSISIVVSEETGYVSLAKNGTLKHDINTEELNKVLLDIYKPKTLSEILMTIWKHKIIH